MATQMRRSTLYLLFGKRDFLSMPILCRVTYWLNWGLSQDKNCLSCLKFFFNNWFREIKFMFFHAENKYVLFKTFLFYAQL